MSDYLVQLGKNPQARQLIKSLGLPIPMPQELKRAKGPSTERALHDTNIGVYTSAASSVAAPLAAAFAQAGVNSYVFGDSATLALFKGPGEAYGRPARELRFDEDTLKGVRLNGLVCDATELKNPEHLRQLYDFFHPLVRELGRCGRIVVIGRPPEAQPDTATAAAQAALEGFVRSIAKEIGKKGSTAQLLYVAEGAESLMAGPLRFLLGPRSAYVSGQPIRLSDKAAAQINTTHWAKPLEGKVALVTGAARGIGEATARLLATEGATVVCLDRPNEDGPLSQLAREIGGGVFLADVTSAQAPDEINSYLMETYGGVDIVVHNAGITRDKTLARMTQAHWDQTIDVNLGALCRITDRLLQGALRDDGRLIFLSSIAGIAGNMGQTNYSASKSGVIGLMQSLAEQVADRGITANAIAPGFIETRLTAAIPFAIREVARRMNSLGQGGKPEDVAQGINFLASPSSQGLTGQVIRVCGGSLVGA